MKEQDMTDAELILDLLRQLSADGGHDKLLVTIFEIEKRLIRYRVAREGLEQAYDKEVERVNELQAKLLNIEKIYERRNENTVNVCLSINRKLYAAMEIIEANGLEEKYQDAIRKFA